MTQTAARIIAPVFHPQAQTSRAVELALHKAWSKLAAIERGRHWRESTWGSDIVSGSASTVSQRAAQLLALLDEPRTINDLGDETRINKQTIRDTLLRLIDMGLVERSRGKGNAKTPNAEWQYQKVAG